MATKNIVPNADSEGGIGTSSKYWATGFIDAITTTGNLVVGGNVTSNDLILTAGTLFGTGNTGFSNRSSDTTLYLQMPATGFNITDDSLNTRFILSSGGDVNIGSADGLPLMHGSVAANASYCTYSFVNDQNTGMIRTGADTLALVTAGSPKLTISSVGDATITATSTSGLKLAQTGQSYYHNIKNQGDSLYIGADDGGQGGTGADMRFAIKGSEAMRLNNGYSVSAPNLQWTTLFDIGLKLSAGSTAIVTVYASSGSGLGMATLLVMRDGYGSQTFTELGTQPTATYLSFRLNPSNLAQLQVNPSISSGNHTIKGKLLIIKS